jgi:hypothetical protein
MEAPPKSVTQVIDVAYKETSCFHFTLSNTPALALQDENLVSIKKLITAGPILHIAL